MIAAENINITKAERSKLTDINLENIPFGKYFTDHMLEVDYEDGEWKNAEIKPYQPLLLDPSLAALHYGQAIFEGIKAYKNEAGEVSIFRPIDNFKRFNISAERMQMPQVPEEIFMEGMRMLIDLDKNWVPQQEDHSLYIRPFMFSNDNMIGVRPSEKYKFMIILSPTGPYYNSPMRIYVEEHYVRGLCPVALDTQKLPAIMVALCMQLHRQSLRATTRFYGPMPLNTNMCRNVAR
jgi:branched-chain amino acid aminotransferase